MPEVLLRLFHPRPELSPGEASPPARDLLIPVADNVVVGPAFMSSPAPWPRSSFSTAMVKLLRITMNWGRYTTSWE